MGASPLDPHVATASEVRERLLAEGAGAPFLVYRDGDNRQVIVDLSQARDRVTIGRRAGNDVALTWDAEVSRLHAELQRSGPQWVVCDEGLSHNGTWVNGERVDARRRLQDGDIISIGETRLAYCSPSEATVGASTITRLVPPVAAQLTPAQRRVLVALCRPFRDSPYAAPATNQQIADELVVAVDTVKSTLRQLFEVFEVGDLAQNQKRAALAIRALEAGAVSRREL